MPIFYVYMNNNRDNRDDEVYKCVAKSPEAAKRMAQRSDGRDRFSVGSALKAKEFRKRYPDWYPLLSGIEAVTAID
jgi:hypothetical protein